MKVKTLFCTLALGAAAGVSHSANAQEHHHKMELTDALFAKKASAGGMTEVELGKLAAQNGDSQDVKDFGSKMVTDHSKINDDLKAVADKDKLTLSDKPTEEQQDMIDKLSKETGKTFDSDYIHAMVKAHIMDRHLFAEESESAKNPDLKQFASDSLPTIKDHLSMIEGIEQSHGLTSTHHHMKSSMASSAMTPPAMASGDAAQSKSGAGPGGTGSTAPDSSPAGGTSADAGSGSAAASAPSTGDAGMSKSGLAPGGNANPAPNPQ